MDIASFREGMKVTKEFCFLNHAANGPLHDNVLEQLHKVADSQNQGNINVDWNQVQDGFHIVRQPIAKLIQCKEEEIALTSSAGNGIGLILESFDWSNPKKKGIIIDDMEFTTNSFAYQQIKKKFKVNLHVIKNDNGTLDLAKYQKLLEKEDISLVGISHVQYANGYKTDIYSLHNLCKKNGSHFLVDAIQSCGALSITAQEADFIAVGSYKWCMGPFATGFLYINQYVQKKLDPICVSALTDRDPLSFTHHEYHPYEDSRKFQSLFNPNFLAMGKAIELLNDVGISKIEEQVFKLTDYLVDELKTIPNIVIDSNRVIDHKSGIIRILSKKNNLNLASIVEELLNKYNIVVSFRNNGIRISPHFYNTFEEIDKLITILKTLMN